MRQNQKGSGALKAAARGVAAGFAVIVILFAAAALFVSLGKLPEELMRPVSLLCALVGALTGGVVAGKGVASRRFLAGTAVGAVMFGVCLIGSAFAEDTSFPSRWHLLLLVAMVPGGAIGGAIAASRRSRRR
ncbi:MAG: TIGR04086 family membrane protein [Oscillospiraceae bacterium]|jgi:putative membrane protein (TIGR04086 family)|nr:TIGR04086 family membrane protein [Oscillospiraceae bacterium]